MKAAWLAILGVLICLTHVSAQEEKPSSKPRNQYGAEATPAKKKKVVDPDAEPTPSRTVKKKIVKKPVDTDESDVPAKPKVKPSPAPTPEKSTPTPTPEPSPDTTPKKSTKSDNSAPNASLTSDELAEFAKQPEKVQKLLESALALTRLDLTYTYGSADPANGGMDCSGFVYYVLRKNGFDDVPRDASGQYVWVRKAKLFQAVLGKKRDTFELDDLKPGDLLFWTGTYASEKDPPITHAMIYLGTEKETHKAVMVGSTDGRTYNGKSRWGVSVFDFKANAVAPQSDPTKQTRAVFVGYAHIPGLRPE